MWKSLPITRTGEIYARISAINYCSYTFTSQCVPRAFLAWQWQHPHNCTEGKWSHLSAWLSLFQRRQLHRPHPLWRKSHELSGQTLSALELQVPGRVQLPAPESIISRGKESKRERRKKGERRMERRIKREREKRKRDGEEEKTRGRWKKDTNQSWKRQGETDRISEREEDHLTWQTDRFSSALTIGMT